MSQEEHDEGFSKPIDLGSKTHPITGELGVVLRVGSEETWMENRDALNLVANLIAVTVTGISTTVTSQMLMQLMARQQAAATEKKIYTPGG